jgi:hypothetical protein
LILDNGNGTAFDILIVLQSLQEDLEIVFHLQSFLFLVQNQAKVHQVEREDSVATIFLADESLLENVFNSSLEWKYFVGDQPYFG